MSSDLADGVPFSFFCSLLREISKAPSHKISSSHHGTPNYPALNIFRRWTTKLRKDFPPLPPGTTAVVFNFLFPDEDQHRKFDMQETQLARNIADSFGIDKAFLDHWICENASGCLGEELRLVLERTSTTAGGHISPLSITQVDELLDELASTSGYSHESIRKKYPTNKRRARLLIIKDLFRTLSPIDASFLTQIILKDLRPILYPLHDTHYIASLLGHNSGSVKMLSKEDAMNIWDPSKWMLNSYRVKATFTETAIEFEKPPSERSRNVPKTGVPVAIPKSEKGRSPRNALQYFCSRQQKQRKHQQVWAETKYDGERAQIHVEVRHGETKITIFSKSKRDSTLDRMAVHDIIYRALGLTKHGTNNQSKVRENVILDAEMVAFDGKKVDEFWRIKGLIEDSQSDSQTSMVTFHSPTRRLGLVFFDILSLNSKSLLMTPYRTRRSILESLIHVVPGECILSHRVSVGVETLDYGEDSQVIALEKIFAESIATYQEGLVLKGEETVYHDFLTPWVKIKRDYIPGYGDTVDMVVIGVTWERERGRVLRVSPSTMTTFYIGGIENSDEIRRQPSRQPHFQVYFTVSYGPTRSQLEEINFLIRSSETISYDSSRKADTLPYTFTLLQGLTTPRYILKEPLLAELYGAGFTKAPKSRHYELRFPRITKIHRRSDRSWTEGVNLKDLHKIACAVVGRDTSDKEARDITAEMWGIPVSPGAHSALKRKTTMDLWRENFAVLDERTSTRGSASHSSPPSPFPAPAVTLLEPDPEIVSLPPPKKPRFSQEQGKSDNIEAFFQPPRAAKDITQPFGIRTNVIVNQPAAFSGHQQSQCSSLEIPRSPPLMPQKPSLKPIQQASPVTHIRAAPACIPAVPNSNLRLLENALVWFAKPRGESWAVRNVVPRGQRVHSVEALLTGCGWYENSYGADWAGKGIIFVNEHSVAGRAIAQCALGMINDRLRVLPSDRPRKGIWILDHKILTLLDETKLFSTTK
ncbi:DNA ligase 4 [Termitomyces sp. T112]|nr:DNA ligase 4 [Termitomyces sp. T112]